MTDIVIRQVEGEELLETFYGLTTYAFQPSPSLITQSEWSKWIESRKGSTCLALFEDNIPVACAASTTMIQNVGGTLFKQAGVWGVATSPGARRKGYSRRLMTALLAANHEAGQVFSCLYPFRESFYENLGYITFPAPQLARLAPEALSPLLEKDLGGTVQLQRIRQGFDDYQAICAGGCKAFTHGGF